MRWLCVGSFEVQHTIHGRRSVIHTKRIMNIHINPLGVTTSVARGQQSAAKLSGFYDVAEIESSCGKRTCQLRLKHRGSVVGKLGEEMFA